MNFDDNELFEEEEEYYELPEDTEDWTEEDWDNAVFTITDKGLRFVELLSKSPQELIEIIQARREDHAYDKEYAMKNGLCMECGAGLLDTCKALEDRKYPLCEECSNINELFEGFNKEVKDIVVTALDWKAHFIS